MLSSVKGLRGAEGAVLAKAIELHPEKSPVSAILKDMEPEKLERKPERDAQTLAAIDGLVEVGLLVRLGDAVEPTPAGLRSGELELGL